MRNWIVVLLFILLLSVPVNGEETYATSLLADGSSVIDQTIDFLFRYKDVSHAAELLREQMLNNDESADIYVYSNNDNAEALYYDMLDIAFDESDNSNAGDYLSWDVKSQKPSYTCGRYYINGRYVYYYHYVVEIEYFTTAEQKEQVNQKVEEIISSFNFTETTTEYEKVEAIYDYICENVVYADEIEEDIVYTAWSALIEHKAVCQGYAQLFYKMAKESDLNVRIIPGISLITGENHGWNIVRIDDKFYNLDVTWDSTRVKSGLEYKYFLKGTNFESHQRLEEFDSEEFHNIYPMSEVDYPVAKKEPVIDNTNQNINNDIKVDTNKKNKEDKINTFKAIKPIIKKVTNKKISIKKISGAIKYNIRYSTNKKFKKNNKNVTIKKTTYKFKKLKKGKTYYVKVRAYKVINKKLISTKWSKVKIIRN